MGEVSLILDAGDRHVNAMQVVSVDLRTHDEHGGVTHVVVLCLADGTQATVAGPDTDRDAMAQMQGQWSRRIESALRSLHAK